MIDPTTKRAQLQQSLRLSAGHLDAAIEAAVADAGRALAGLWQRDASVWSADAATQKQILNRLGWMSSLAIVRDSIERLSLLGQRAAREGITDVVLLGMGGSSLAPEVLRAVLGVATGRPRFQMLDSTDPAAVKGAETPPATTLYVLASKSGTTIEPNSMAAHFRHRLEEARVPRWADHFVAITDHGTELERHARAEGFRDLFVNPSDIGGRYSAISFFGMVPAALMGIDVAALIEWASALFAAAEPATSDVSKNPAAALGLAMGAAARGGRDKLTLILPPTLEPFGLWVEQLVAESTGKAGKGIVPIAGESLAAPSAYGSDRLFVRLRLHGSRDEEQRDADVKAIAATGAPVVEIELQEPLALGAEFVRWEIATAVAGALLGINPFDEPNVQQAKDATKRILAGYSSKGTLAAAQPDQTLPGHVALTLSTAARDGLHDEDPSGFLKLLHQGDYFALLAFVPPNRGLLDELQAFRQEVRDRARVATMFGYGPRYLHSTGQLHKGGPDSGVFVLISATPSGDVAIPGEPFSFGTLEQAQALGDFASLDTTGRRALHVHLPAVDRALVRDLADALLSRLSRARS